MNTMQSTILVLDDEPDLLELLSAILIGAGYQVQTVQTADSMEMHLKEAELPNLLILDLLLAGSHGGELVHHLKEDERTRDIPILMVSAHPGAEVEAHARGADAFLAKPFDIDEFLSIVESLLTRHIMVPDVSTNQRQNQTDLLTSSE